MKKSPPAYRPLPQPRVLQKKSRTVSSNATQSTPKIVQAKPASPTAPPVYRPQPPAKVLQTKRSSVPPINASLVRSRTIQRVLMIGDDDYFDHQRPVQLDLNNVSAKGKQALNSKANLPHQNAIITQLNVWAADKRGEYEYKNWQFAIKDALNPAGVQPTRTFKDDVGTVGEGYTEEPKKPVTQPPTPSQDRRQELLAPMMQQVDDYERTHTTSHGGQHQSLARAMSLSATAAVRKEELEKSSLSKKEKKREKKKIQHIEENARRKEGPHNQGGGKGQFG
jgi:hypothetical protein